MSITGNIKCFELSSALLKDGALCVASTGAATQDNVIDFNELSRWESVGSSDATTETLTITLSEPAMVSRLFVLNHNFKDYTITPVISNFILDHVPVAVTDHLDDELEDDGSILPFRNVLSLISSTETEGISEVDYSLSNSYYEFDKIFIEGYVITITKAQELNDVPDQEKFCFRSFTTIEVDENAGTFEGFPQLVEGTNFQSADSRSLNGRFDIQKLQTVLNVAMALVNAPIQNDVTLVDHLRERQGKFLLWPCGGKRSPAFFRFDSRLYKVGDIFQVQVNAGNLASYISHIFSNPVNMSIGIVEVI